MVKEILELLSYIDNVEDMDVIAYHVKRRQEILIKQAKLTKQLNS